MGQKTNPISLRLRVNRDHDSSWFSDYHYTKNVATDLQIRNYLQKAFSRAKLCHIRTVVQHLPNQINVYPKAYNYLQKKRNQRRRGAKHSNIIDKLESVDPFFMTEEAKIENLPGMIKSGSRLLNTNTFWESRKTLSGASSGAFTLVKAKAAVSVSVDWNNNFLFILFFFCSFFRFLTIESRKDLWAILLTTSVCVFCFNVLELNKVCSGASNACFSCFSSQTLVSALCNLAVHEEEG